MITFWLLDCNGSSKVSKPLCRSASADEVLACYLAGHWPRLSGLTGTCSCYDGAACKNQCSQALKGVITSSSTPFPETPKVDAKVTDGMKAQEVHGGCTAHELTLQVN